MYAQKRNYVKLCANICIQSSCLLAFWIQFACLYVCVCYVCVCAYRIVGFMCIWLWFVDKCHFSLVCSFGQRWNSRYFEWLNRITLFGLCISAVYQLRDSFEMAKILQMFFFSPSQNTLFPFILPSTFLCVNFPFAPIEQWNADDIDWHKHNPTSKSPLFLNFFHVYYICDSGFASKSIAQSEILQWIVVVIISPRLIFKRITHLSACMREKSVLVFE